MSDNHDLLNDNDMCSFSGYEVYDMCSNNDITACGDGSLDVKEIKSSATKRRISGLFRKLGCKA